MSNAASLHNIIAHSSNFAAECVQSTYLGAKGKCDDDHVIVSTEIFSWLKELPAVTTSHPSFIARSQLLGHECQAEQSSVYLTHHQCDECQRFVAGLSRTATAIFARASRVR